MMLFLFIILTSSSYADECFSWIAESEISRALALEPGAGSKQCGGDDPCICFQGVDWETATYDPQNKKFSVDNVKQLAKQNKLEAKKKEKQDQQKECEEALASLDKPSATNAELKRAMKAMTNGCR